MGTVRDILARKGSQVFSIGPNASVLDAALLMNEHKVGALVVTDDGRVVGMFTERDVLCRVVGQRRDPAGTRVGEVMSREIVCCRPETTIDEARTVMKERRIRHLPLVDEERRLMGLVSIGDLNAYESSSQEHTIHMLHEYLYGRV